MRAAISDASFLESENRANEKRLPNGEIGSDLEKSRSIHYTEM